MRTLLILFWCFCSSLDMRSASVNFHSGSYKQANSYRNNYNDGKYDSRGSKTNLTLMYIFVMSFTLPFGKVIYLTLWFLQCLCFSVGLLSLLKKVSSWLNPCKICRVLCSKVSWEGISFANVSACCSHSLTLSWALATTNCKDMNAKVL